MGVWCVGVGMIIIMKLIIMYNFSSRYVVVTRFIIRFLSFYFKF